MASAEVARRFLEDQFRSEPVSEDSLFRAQLLTTELVTNGVLHARTRLTLGVVNGDDRVLVTVEDANQLLPEQQPYSDTRTSGRGMALLRELAQEWGIDVDDEGKTVWFTLPRAMSVTATATA